MPIKISELTELIVVTDDDFVPILDSDVTITKKIRKDNLVTDITINIVDDTTPQLGGNLDPNGKFIGMDKGGDIASASPLVIDTDGDMFDVTGTINFSAMTVAANRFFVLQFDGALTMTHSAGTLDLPWGVNITTATGGMALCYSTAANVVRVISYITATQAQMRTLLGLVIGTDVLPELTVVTRAAAEAGTATVERVWTAQRVKQAINALGGVGGADDRLEVYIDAKQMVPTGGINPPLTRQETATNAINYETRDFDQTTRESAYFQVRSPDNWDLGNITFDIIWTALAGTGDVRWQIFANSLSNDDAIDQAFGADTALTDTLLATEDIHIASLNFTPGLTPAAGDIVFARIDRRAATAEDTLNADANLIGVRIKFVTTA